MRPAHGHLAFLAALLAAGSARAQSSDPAAAQALFDEAKRLVGQGRPSDACPRFLASLKLDPAPGAAMNLADCYEKIGKTATAWARYLEAASLAQQAGQVDREHYARGRAAELEPTLSRLVVAAPGAPRGLEVTRDGVALDAAAWGTSVPVDPGHHVVAARAPGKQPWSTTVVVSAADTRARVEIPALLEAPASPPDRAHENETPSPGWPARKTGAVALMGTGAVGAVIGGVFAARAHGVYSELDRACPSHHVCDPGLAPTLSSYHTASAVSVASFIGGGAVLGTGVIVYLTAPSAGSRTGSFVVPRLGAGYVGLEGGF